MERVNKKYDEWLLKIFITPKNKFNKQLYKVFHTENKYQNIKNYINNRYPEITTPNETLRRIQYNIEEKPVCPICGKYTKYVGKPDSRGLYTALCSQKCSTKYTNNWQYADYEKAKQTKLEKYGYSSFNVKKSVETKRKLYGENFEKIFEKGKQTKLELYGDENYNNREKFYQTIKEKYGKTWVELAKTELREKTKQTLLERYGDENYNNIEQIQKTNLERYGVNTPLKNEEVKKKIKQTNLEKYGGENPMRSLDIINKVKQTNLEKYGVECPMNNEEIKNKIKESNLEKYGNIYWGSSEEGLKILRSIENIEKIKQTNLKRYGTEWWSTLDENKQILSKIIKSEEIQQKIYNTHKKNNSFNKSKREEDLFNKIKEIYPNLLSQYKDKRYPWKCDFYIPELDLFIEYQGKPDHGGHIYDKNNINDINTLNKWIKRNNEIKNQTLRKYTRYDNMISCWTIYDPLKRETAKKNNLNYLEIWPNWSNDKILKEINKYKKEEVE